MENNKWVSVEERLPELEKEVLLTHWLKSEKREGFWWTEVGSLQEITIRKTSEGEVKRGSFRFGEDWTSSLPQYWCEIPPLPSPPKQTP